MTIIREERIGPHRLIQADCMDVLPGLGKVDAVVTDPPYGITHSTNYGASWAGKTIAGDQDTSKRDDVVEWAGTVSGVYFGTWKTPPVAGVRGCVVWDKGPAFGMGDLSFPWKPSFELAYITGKDWSGARDEGVLRGPVVVSWESRGRVHPHQKPVWLVATFIQKAPKAQTILDPFMGSGTTGVACVKENRTFIGIELDPDYFDIACRRVDEAMREPRLDLPEPVKPVQQGFEL